MYDVRSFKKYDFKSSTIKRTGWDLESFINIFVISHIISFCIVINGNVTRFTLYIYIKELIIYVSRCWHFEIDHKLLFYWRQVYINWSLRKLLRINPINELLVGSVRLLMDAVKILAVLFESRTTFLMFYLFCFSFTRNCSIHCKS